MEALQVLEEESCSQCGGPIWLCHSDSPHVDVEIGYDNCIVADKVQQVQEKESKNKKKSKTKGQIYGKIIPLMEGSVLPTRNDYFKQLQERLG